MTPEQFEIEFSKLQEGFATSLPPVRCAAYWERLKSVDHDVFARSVKALLTSGLTKMPSIDQILHTIEDEREKIRRANLAKDKRDAESFFVGRFKRRVMPAVDDEQFEHEFGSWCAKIIGSDPQCRRSLAKTFLENRAHWLQKNPDAKALVEHYVEPSERPANHWCPVCGAQSDVSEESIEIIDEDDHGDRDDQTYHDAHQ